MFVVIAGQGGLLKDQLQSLTATHIYRAFGRRSVCAGVLSTALHCMCTYRRTQSDVDSFTLCAQGSTPVGTVCTSRPGIHLGKRAALQCKQASFYCMQTGCTTLCRCAEGITLMCMFTHAVKVLIASVLTSSSNLERTVYEKELCAWVSMWMALSWMIKQIRHGVCLSCVCVWPSESEGTKLVLHVVSFSLERQPK